MGILNRLLSTASNPIVLVLGCLSVASLFATSDKEKIQAKKEERALKKLTENNGRWDELRSETGKALKDGKQ